MRLKSECAYLQAVGGLCEVIWLLLMKYGSGSISLSTCVEPVEWMFDVKLASVMLCRPVNRLRIINCENWNIIDCVGHSAYGVIMN